MKKNLSKAIGVMAMAGIMGTTGVTSFACSEEDTDIQAITSVYHFDCEEIIETGRDERLFYVIGSTSSDIHNRLKLHYYNASSEPVKIYIGNRELIVDAWSSNELYMSVSHGQALSVIIRGEHNSITQALNGYLSVKSYDAKIYSEEDTSISMQEKASTHHFYCEEIIETGRDERLFYVTGSTSSDIHNQLKLHYYNASSEPVKIYIGNRELIVDAWSSNELYMSVSHGQALCVIIRGEHNSITQALNGYLSVKTYNDEI